MWVWVCDGNEKENRISSTDRRGFAWTALATNCGFGSCEQPFTLQRESKTQPKGTKRVCIRMPLCAYV